MDEKVKQKLIQVFLKNEKGDFFEIKHKRASSIASHYLIQQDLRKSILSIQKAISHAKLNSKKIDDLIISSLWIQAIMCYSRCFTKSDEGFSKLEASTYFKSKSSKHIHTEIMMLRNNYLAHRGDNSNETSMVVLGINESNDRIYHIPTALKTGHYFHTYKSKIKHIQSIESKVEKIIATKVKSLDNFLDNEIFKKVKEANYDKSN